jgi:3-methyladenine DNA glycosylase/8-oxoguanine DNA glycosylase
VSAAEIELRLEVRPRWVFRLPRRYGLDGLARVRGGVLHRLLHAGESPVLVRVAQLSSDRVLFGARADERAAAEWGIERVRAALGIDQDLGGFYERFRFDPLIGHSVRANPGLRVYARPDPFEALTWAITEQLIEYERAAAIQRTLVARLGRRCLQTGMRDAPSAATLAAQSPALLEACGLSGGRSITLMRVAREVASGRVDLHDPEHERGWLRLRAIPGIGPWTVQSLALHGQGRLDQLPVADLAFLKLVGALRTGNPRARATEEEVAALFEPYAPWAGLVGAHALRAASALSVRPQVRDHVARQVEHVGRAEAGREVPSRGRGVVTVAAERHVVERRELLGR